MVGLPPVARRVRDGDVQRRSDRGQDTRPETVLPAPQQRAEQGRGASARQPMTAGMSALRAARTRPSDIPPASFRRRVKTALAASSGSTPEERVAGARPGHRSNGGPGSSSQGSMNSARSSGIAGGAEGSARHAVAPTVVVPRLLHRGSEVDGIYLGEVEGARVVVVRVAEDRAQAGGVLLPLGAGPRVQQRGVRHLVGVPHDR